MVQAQPITLIYNPCMNLFTEPCMIQSHSSLTVSVCHWSDFCVPDYSFEVVPNMLHGVNVRILHRKCRVIHITSWITCGLCIIIILNLTLLTNGAKWDTIVWVFLQSKILLLSHGELCSTLVTSTKSCMSYL